MLNEILKRNNMEMEDIIKIIFDYQENNSSLGKIISGELKEIHKEEERQYLNLKEELEKSSQNTNEIREILDKVIAYKQLMLTETSILNERYYRMGLKNGVCLIIECLKEEA